MRASESKTKITLTVLAVAMPSDGAPPALSLESPLYSNDELLAILKGSVRS
jgi:hypothetical protein